MTLVPVIVSYHSNKWIRVAIGSYLKWFPETPYILVVDNNPELWEDHPNDEGHRTKQGLPNGHCPEVEHERHWLLDHPKVRLIRNDTGLLSYGRGLDVAKHYLTHDQPTDFMLVLEPDIITLGREWLEKSLELMSEFNVVTNLYQAHFPYIGGSLWNLSKITTSFEARPKAADEISHPAYSTIFSDSAWGPWHSRQEIEWFNHNWVCGEQAIFYAHVLGKLYQRPTDDLEHVWQGSSNPNYNQRLEHYRGYHCWAHLQEFKCIIVVGPHGSGTQELVLALAKNLNRRPVTEGEIEWDSVTKIDHFRIGNTPCIIEAPGLTHVAHRLVRHDTAIVFMKRSYQGIEDTLRSTNWEPEKWELAKYGLTVGLPHEVKHAVWDMYQKGFCYPNAFEITHEELLEVTS